MKGMAMRSVDERVAAVRARAAHIKRRRSRIAVAAPVAAALVVVVNILGISAVGAGAPLAPVDPGLFGATSMFDSRIGGYVLVGIASAAIAALVTVLGVSNKHRSDEQPDDQTTNDEDDQQQR